MTRKLAGFGLAFALAELAAAYLPPLASLLTAALFISLFLFAAFTQRRAARFALPAVAGLLAGLVWSAAYQLAVVKPAQSLAGQTYACTAIVQPGGSIRDDNVIETCDKYGMVMAFTGLRLFHH